MRSSATVHGQADHFKSFTHGTAAAFLQRRGCHDRGGSDGSDPESRWPLAAGTVSCAVRRLMIKVGSVWFLRCRE